MCCPYCKNKTENEYLVKSESTMEGVEAKVIKRNRTALLSVSGWFDDFVVIGPEYAKINCCPNCGAKVTPKCSETTTKVVER